MLRCVFLGQRSERAERAGAAVPGERSLATVLTELLSEEWLMSFVSCVKKRVCVEGVRVIDEDFVNDVCEVGTHKSRDLSYLK